MVTSIAPIVKVQYAGFWKRFFAFLIDMIILGVPTGIFLALAGNGQGFLNYVAAIIAIALFVGGWVVFTVMESSERQATPGKAAMGIKVTDLDGNRISMKRAAARNLAMIIVSWLLLGYFCIPFLMAGWTKKKQALHDMMTECLVVQSGSA